MDDTLLMRWTNVFGNFPAMSDFVDADFWVQALAARATGWLHCGQV